jgi:hypothetical protein
MPDKTTRTRANAQALVYTQINGGRGRNRTADTGIFNPLLYQLSYPARCSAQAGRPGLLGRVMRGRDDTEARVGGQARLHPCVAFRSPPGALRDAGYGALLRLSSVGVLGRWMTRKPWSAALWQDEHALDKPS